MTGDPHVETTWNPAKNAFPFQAQGIWRLMRTETCGSVVEVQAFFCQYRYTTLSSAIAYAIKINDNDRYIIRRAGDVELVVGNPSVENIGEGANPPFDPALGQRIVSDDTCARFTVNTQPLYGAANNRLNGTAIYLNNIFMNIWGCATTEEGVCGNATLGSETVHMTC